MTGTTQTIRSYQLSDFPNNECNAAILNQQIKNDATVTTDPASVNRSGSTVAIAFNSLITAAEEAQLDVLVAAHQGNAFQQLPIAQYSEAQSSDDTGDEVTKLSVLTDPLPAGVYFVSWSQELAVTADNAGATKCVGRLMVTKNGGTAVERASESGQGAGPDDDWEGMGASLALTIYDGETYQFDLTFQRVGTSGNAALARRSRITLAKLSEIPS